MPTYYHGGSGAVNPTRYMPESADEDEKKVVIDRVKREHPLTQPAHDRIHHQAGKVYIKKPAAFCPLDQSGNPIQQYEEWVPGSITLALVGHGFYVVKPGGSVIVDSSVPERVVKSHAPHLLTEAEYLAQKGKSVEAEPEKAEAEKPEPTKKAEKSSAKA